MGSTVGALAYIGIGASVGGPAGAAIGGGVYAAQRGIAYVLPKIGNEISRGIGFIMSILGK